MLIATLDFGHATTHQPNRQGPDLPGRSVTPRPDAPTSRATILRPDQPGPAPNCNISLSSTWAGPFKNTNNGSPAY